ncbi:MAG: hypothetical protein K0Q73_2464 [Paenibacillus sp.]|nr:hypothetical protein [Paenibacillus sp.]
MLQFPKFPSLQVTNILGAAHFSKLKELRLLSPVLFLRLLDFNFHGSLINLIKIIIY